MRYGSGIGIVHFLEYRQHDQARTSADDAIMALLAGAKLASHTLQLTEGSEQLLPSIYPNVAHIRRFNLLTSRARELLDDAEEHLGAMAVPYVLAIHESFVMTCLELLNVKLGNVTARRMHQRLADEIGVSYGPALGAYQAARILRNAIIHSGGIWTSQAVSETQHDVDHVADRHWTGYTHRSLLQVAPGTIVTVGHGELVATLAITTALARLINVGLQTALPRDRWADLLIADIAQSEPSLLTHPNALRKCGGYAAHLYRPLNLTSGEIAAALTRAGQ